MKRSAIKRRPLADSVLKTLEPEHKAYRELDGNGLYLEVRPDGRKSWVLRYKRPNGKWAWKGLGGFPAVSGKLARQQTQQYKELLANGEDIHSYKNGQKVEEPSNTITFRDVGEEWYQRNERSGRSRDTLKQHRRYLDKDVYPLIGDKPLDQITRADCAQIQSRIEERASYEIAKKVRGWVNQIFSLAVGQGKCEVNPASELRHIAQERPQRNHYPHLVEDELPAFLKALRQSRSRWKTVTMVRLVLRTACRPGMARWAEWSEFDLKKGWWVIPETKMKVKGMGDHHIPLARQTIEDLEKLYEATGQGRYLFPGVGSVNPVASENTVNKALTLIGYKDRLVGHGSRHTASTLLNEHLWDSRLVEAQLAHKLDGMAGVYNKAKYAGLRRELMQWYADYLDYLEGIGEKPAGPAQPVAAVDPSIMASE